MILDLSDINSRQKLVIHHFFHIIKSFRVWESFKPFARKNSYYRNSDLGKTEKADRDYKRIKPVIQYIHGNLESNLSLDELAGIFYLSKYHLGYLFKKATGFTINEYIISRRISKARELLKNNLPVSQVCEMVGFRNLSHFIRTFKKMVGMSPKKYAKRG